MLFPFVPDDDGDTWVYTVCKAEDGAFVKVGMTEEELFRSVLGDKEFEKRRREARRVDLAAREERQDVMPLTPDPFYGEFLNTLAFWRWFS